MKIIKIALIPVFAILLISATASADDKRLKKDVVALINSLENITQLQGVKYIDTRDKHAQTQFGLVAQDVQKIFPEVVHRELDGYEYINYNGLVASLIEAVKELDKQNRNLTGHIEKLIGEVVSLQERIEMIEQD